MCSNCGYAFECRCEKLKTDDVVQYLDDERVELVNHPSHYGGDTTYEAIKVIEAWELGFCLGNAVKYISRAGKKNALLTVEDLTKAVWYLEREIKKLES